MKELVLNVEGMSCSHCSNAVSKAVGALDGVAGVVVDLAKKTVAVSFDPEKLQEPRIKEVIEDQGYDVK